MQDVLILKLNIHLLSIWTPLYDPYTPCAFTQLRHYHQQRCLKPQVKRRLQLDNDTEPYIKDPSRCRRHILAPVPYCLQLVHKQAAPALPGGYLRDERGNRQDEHQVRDRPVSSCRTKGGWRCHAGLDLSHNITRPASLVTREKEISRIVEHRTALWWRKAGSAGYTKAACATVTLAFSISTLPSCSLPSPNAITRRFTCSGYNGVYKQSTE